MAWLFLGCPLALCLRGPVSDFTWRSFRGCRPTGCQALGRLLSSCDLRRVPVTAERITVNCTLAFRASAQSWHIPLLLMFYWLKQVKRLFLRESGKCSPDKHLAGRREGTFVDSHVTTVRMQEGLDSHSPGRLDTTVSDWGRSAQGTHLHWGGLNLTLGEQGQVSIC